MKTYLNDGWFFTREWTDELKTGVQEGMDAVRIPHTVKVTPFHYFDEKEYEAVSGYVNPFYASWDLQNKHVTLTFEGAAHEATVYVNGEEMITHSCGYTAFCVDLDGHLHYGQENIIAVKLDSRETLNQPPFGHVVDYMTYGGIYRDVYLDIRPQVYLKEVLTEVEDILDVTKIMHTKVTLSEEGVSGYEVRQSIIDHDGHSVIHYSEMKEPEMSYGITDVELWSPENPKLYYIRTELITGGEVVDSVQTKIGFRTAEWRADGFYLNGEKIKLRGLNRHQSFPYVGYAMPERAQRRDADILKDELGCNFVRTSHYPQSHYFLDECDEKGLLVFTEIPGWQHIGDEDWKKQACKNVEEMILQYKDHPSIILWGVRINESVDDDDFYKETNRIAHALDKTRQTGGVRYLQNSHLYEDVYTYNDFLHKGDNPGVAKRKSVTKNKEAGYLVSEFNGHMYPTKMFDKESVRLELALRHANVVNDYYEAEDIAGGSGWCMFDYNTHKDFGSGDRICYHGVMDMFRNPKLAGHFYESQSDNHPVLEISSTMCIGEHPGCNIGTVYAFTNADCVKVYKNDEFVREYVPDRTKGRHKSLPHPPIAMNDFIGELMEKHEKYNHKTCEKMKSVLLAVQEYGMNDLPLLMKLRMLSLMVTKFISMKKATELYGTYVAGWGNAVTVYRFEAWKDGELVATKEIRPGEKRILKAEADSTLLMEQHSYDVASVRIRMEDEFGNLLPFYNGPVKLRVEGDIELIGPDTVALQGGCFGTYVKSVGKSGVGKLVLETPDGESAELTFNVLV